VVQYLEFDVLTHLNQMKVRKRRLRCFSVQTSGRTVDAFRRFLGSERAFPSPPFPSPPAGGEGTFALSHLTEFANAHTHLCFETFSEHFLLQNTRKLR